MAHISERAAEILARKLSGAGLAGRVAEALAAGGIPAGEYGELTPLRYRISFEALEKHTLASFPVLLVYCREIRNEMAEKFRSFSGVSKLVVEIGVSRENLDELHAEAQAFIDSAAEILRESQGAWDADIYFGGAYEVEIGQIRRGGRHFVQRVEFQVPVWSRKN
jgi:hypothetical protein